MPYPTEGTGSGMDRKIPEIAGPLLGILKAARVGSVDLEATFPTCMITATCLFGKGDNDHQTSDTAGYITRSVPYGSGVAETLEWDVR